MVSQWWWTMQRDRQSRHQHAITIKKFILVNRVYYILTLKHRVQRVIKDRAGVKETVICLGNRLALAHRILRLSC